MDTATQTVWPGVSGAVCLVTGAGQGIGEAIARSLAAAGAVVGVMDSNEDRVAAVVGSIRYAGGRAFSATADVRNWAGIVELVSKVEDRHGPIKVLVNVAGVLRTGVTTRFSEQDWELVFGVNATGVFIVSRAVAERMVGRGSGAIVTVGSNSAAIARSGMVAYAASKAAASVFTRCLGLELAPYGVRCNVVSPGSTDTPMQRSLWKDDDAYASVIKGSLAMFRPGIPLGRIAAPNDVADAVLFMVSDYARHITMQELYVDGGATLRL
jgi:2,3-dihydro-2,3-dihydroxybenzoate dehydrogenase